jgi:hypothetical protein
LIGSRSGIISAQSIDLYPHDSKARHRLDKSKR